MSDEHHAQRRPHRPKAETLPLIRALAGILPPSEIAAEVKLNTHTVISYAANAGISLEGTRRRRLDFVVARKTRARLAVEAGQRGKTVNQLAADILDIVANDKLFNAVLGDE